VAKGWEERKFDCFVAYVTDIKTMSVLARRITAFHDLHGRSPDKLDPVVGAPLLAEAESRRPWRVHCDRRWSRCWKYPGSGSGGRGRWRAGMAIATVRVWYAEDGWGVLDCPETPGGCFAHFSNIEMSGYRALERGAQVDLAQWEAPGFKQDGFDYRAVRVVP
jgi:CspA family cold shock protein